MMHTLCRRKRIYTMNFFKCQKKIAPFSHFPSWVYISGTSLQVFVSPSFLVIEDVISKKRVEYGLLFRGRASKFTVVNDVIQNNVSFSFYVQGKLLNGKISVCDALSLTFTKIGEEIQLQTGTETILCKVKEPIILYKSARKSERQKGKLELGITKKMLMHEVVSRCDVRELYELIFAYSRWLPPAKEKEYSTEQLKNTAERIFSRDMTLSIKDYHYSGGEYDKTESPLVVLSQLAQSIISMFVRIVGTSIFLLEKTDHNIHSGRLSDLECDDFYISLRFSKKEMRQFEIIPKRTEEFIFKTKYMISCRVRQNRQKTSSQYNFDTKITLQEGTRYLFDDMRA